MPKLGPYALNEIYCGECSRMLAALPDGCIDLCVTSPPYDSLRLYNGYTFDVEPIARELYRVTKPGGVLVWVVGDATIDGSETGTGFRQALYFRDICGFNLRDTMIWQSDKPPMNDNRYQACFEYMFIFSKNKPKTVSLIKTVSLHPGIKHSGNMRAKNGQITERTYINRTGKQKPRISIWYFPHSSVSEDKEAYEHPAIFPEALARDHILSWSNPGDIVLDPMIGSGTTAKMAYQLHRRYLGFDISQEYVDLARRRVAMADTPLPLVESEQPEVPEQLTFETINES